MNIVIKEKFTRSDGSEYYTLSLEENNLSNSRRELNNFLG